MGRPAFDLPLPAKIVGQAHGSCGVAFHGVNAAISGACAASDHRERLWRQAIDPLVGRDWLAGVRIGSQSLPSSLPS